MRSTNPFSSISVGFSFIPVIFIIEIFSMLSPLQRGKHTG